MGTLKWQWGVAGDGVLPSFSPRPPMCDRPPQWVAHRQLGSCLPPFWHLLMLVRWRVLLNGRCFARIVNGSHGRERSFEREEERERRGERLWGGERATRERGMRREGLGWDEPLESLPVLMAADIDGREDGTKGEGELISLLN